MKTFIFYCLLLAFALPLIAQNVGIGTSTPGVKLDVFNEASNSVTAQFLSAGGWSEIRAGTVARHLKLGADEYAGYIGLNNYGDLRFYVADVQYATISHSGNLGIGTGTPAYRLDAYDGGENATIARFINNGGYANILVSNSSKSATIGADDFGGYIGTNSPDDVRITTGGYEQIRIKNNSGFIGIGTQNPEARLHVSGDVLVEGTIMQEFYTQPTLLNNWEDYGEGYSWARFYKDREWVVHLNGLVRYGTNPIIMVLPPGYRPDYTIMFTVISENSFARIDIDNTGVVRLVGDYSNEYVSLDGITFRAGYQQ